MTRPAASAIALSYDACTEVPFTIVTKDCSDSHIKMFVAITMATQAATSCGARTVRDYDMKSFV